jgi:hypothetical protein
VSQDSNCKNYTNNLCSECYSSFYYNSTLGKCVPTNQNCKTVTSNNQCTSCYSGYQLNPLTFNCDYSSSSSSPTQSGQQQTSYSSSSNANGQFITLNGFIYQISSQGQMIGPLSPASLSSSAATATDPNCAAYANGQCISCLYRYYLTNAGCAAVDANCASWTASGQCLQCQSGFSVINSSCVQTYSNPSANQTPSLPPSTSSCYTRQVLINGACVNVSDLCKSWSSSTALCTGCYQGYSLSSSGVCAL